MKAILFNFDSFLISLVIGAAILISICFIPISPFIYTYMKMNNRKHSIKVALFWPLIIMMAPLVGTHSAEAKKII